MGKYVYLYYTSKDTTDAGDMDAWGKWFGELGDKLVDAGNQFGDGAKAVYKGGVMEVQGAPATGYSIVKAGSMTEAMELAKGCPIAGANNAAVCVYEALPM